MEDLEKAKGIQSIGEISEADLEAVQSRLGSEDIDFRIEERFKKLLGKRKVWRIKLIRGGPLFPWEKARWN